MYTTKLLNVAFQNDPSHVTIEWVLQMVERRIERHNNPAATYLIDFIPNLKYMLKLEPLLKDCTRHMEAFEEKVRLVG